MKETWNWIQLGFMAIGSFLGWFFGDIDGLLYTLIMFVFVDYITGVLRGIVEKKLSSQIGARGIVKKVMIFLLVGISHMLDVEIIGSGSVLRNAVIFFYISNEGISLIENAVKIGLPVPEKLKQVLEQIHEKNENMEEK